MRLNSACVCAKVAASIVGFLLARIPASPSIQARPKLERLKPALAALRSTSARSSGVKAISAAAVRCLVWLPDFVLGRGLAGIKVLTYKRLGVPNQNQIP